MLIHVGINTVSLKGDGFTTFVNTGDTVTKGQLLLEFDMKAIQDAGLPLITPVLIPSGQDAVTQVVPSGQGIVTVAQETVMTVEYSAK